MENFHGWSLGQKGNRHPGTSSEARQAFFHLLPTFVVRTNPQFAFFFSSSLCGGTREIVGTKNNKIVHGSWSKNNPSKRGPAADCPLDSIVRQLRAGVSEYGMGQHFRSETVINVQIFPKCQEWNKMLFGGMMG